MIQIEKKNGWFDFKPLYGFFQDFADGVYQITIKRVRRARTLDQNAWLWGIVYPMLLKGLLDAGWEFTSIEQVHEFFKKQMTIDNVVNKDTGEVIEFPQSTSLMDTVTFSTYVDKLREYAREFLNMEIPDPDKALKRK
ncbi:MAG: hypothetical protein LIP01_10500 [Tannerellaceae bacterium]|nr:hypothetical protein [Tannerellaceae bacterium]